MANVKPGDLAMFVVSYANNHGAVVRIISQADPVVAGMYGKRKGNEPVWLIDTVLMSNVGTLGSVVADHQVRRISPDAEDMAQFLREQVEELREVREHTRRTIWSGGTFRA